VGGGVGALFKKSTKKDIINTIVNAKFIQTMVLNEANQGADASISCSSSVSSTSASTEIVVEKEGDVAGRGADLFFGIKGGFLNRPTPPPKLIFFFVSVF
jgi:hypothetical protein